MWGGVCSSMGDCLLSMHKPLGLITSTTLARVVDRHLLRAAQHRTDLSFWEGLGMVLPKRETPCKVFPSRASYAAKLGAPTTASGMSKGAALNILWHDLRLLAPDIRGEVALPTLFVEVQAHPLATLVAPRKNS